MFQDSIDLQSALGKNKFDILDKEILENLRFTEYLIFCIYPYHLLPRECALFSRFNCNS